MWNWKLQESSRSISCLQRDCKHVLRTWKNTFRIISGCPQASVDHEELVDSQAMVSHGERVTRFSWWKQVRKRSVLYTLAHVVRKKPQMNRWIEFAPHVQDWILTFYWIILAFPLLFLLFAGGLTGANSLFLSMFRQGPNFFWFLYDACTGSLRFRLLIPFL